MANNIYDTDNLELLVHTNNKITKANFGSAAYRDAAEPNISWDNINDTDLVDKIQVDNRIGNNEQIFIAKYNDTTYEEILKAHEAKKAIFAYGPDGYFYNGIYNLSQIYEEQTTAIFIKIADDALHILICYNSIWNHQMVGALEFTKNKITNISSSSTNSEYPSALAVKNYVDSQIPTGGAIVINFTPENDDDRKPEIIASILPEFTTWEYPRNVFGYFKKVYPSEQAELNILNGIWTYQGPAVDRGNNFRNREHVFTKQTFIHGSANEGTFETDFCYFYYNNDQAYRFQFYRNSRLVLDINLNGKETYRSSSE